jgi:hypothetical protein
MYAGEFVLGDCPPNASLMLKPTMPTSYDVMVMGVRALIPIFNFIASLFMMK